MRWDAANQRNLLLESDGEMGTRRGRQGRGILRCPQPRRHPRQPHCAVLSAGGCSRVPGRTFSPGSVGVVPKGSSGLLAIFGVGGLGWISLGGLSWFGLTNTQLCPAFREEEKTFLVFLRNPADYQILPSIYFCWRMQKVFKGVAGSYYTLWGLGIRIIKFLMTSAESRVSQRF